MTTQAEELLGAELTGADGKAIGTVEQVFGDDSSGAPAWARLRQGKQSRFVPLESAHVTRDGLTVPFDADQIAGGPKIDADQHISAEQADELSAYYYSLAIPEQAETEQPSRSSRSGEQQRGSSKGQQTRSEERPRARSESQQQAQPRGESRPSGRGKTGDEWLVRREERLQVGKQEAESGHVKLHRYVESEPVEEKIRLFHDEFDVERVPVSSSEPCDDDFGEDEREITLHEEQGMVSKQTVPVERMRLVTNRVEEDETFRDEVRRERIEVEPQEERVNTRQRKAR